MPAKSLIAKLQSNAMQTLDSRLQANTLSALKAIALASPPLRGVFRTLFPCKFDLSKFAYEGQKDMQLKTAFHMSNSRQEKKMFIVSVCSSLELYQIFTECALSGKCDVSGADFFGQSSARSHLLRSSWSQVSASLPLPAMAYARCIFSMKATENCFCCQSWC